MTLRVAQDPENVGGRGVEKAVYFDAVGHPSADYEGIRTGHSRPLATA